MDNLQAAKLFYWFSNSGGGGSVTCAGDGQTFNGTDQLLYVVDNGALNIASASGFYSLCGWAKASLKANSYLFGKSVHGGTNGECCILQNAGKVIQLQFVTSTGERLFTSGIDGDVDTDLHHFAAIIDLTNSLVYIFVDGSLLNAGGTSFTGEFASLGNQFKFVIGAENNSIGTGYEDYANSTMKDIRVYHKDISANLTEIMAGESVGDEVAWWCLSNGNFTDISGNGFNLTSSGI